MRQRNGFVYERGGRIYARITFTDAQGKKRNLVRLAKNRTDAGQILKKLNRQIDDEGGRGIDAARMTIAHLCDYYLKHFGKPAEYAEGRKVTGLRDVRNVKRYVGIIQKYFGRRLLRSITFGDLLEFKRRRLATPTRTKKSRTLTTVNREMEYLRRLFTIAHREGWLLHNPFQSGESLISSGEGLGNHFRDDKTADKRGLVIESEFAKVLKIAARTGNILTTVVRELWDKDAVNSLSKGDPFNATDVHLSFIGHITREELNANLRRGDISNGFCNRFLWCWSDMSRKLPFGADLDDIDLSPEIARITGVYSEIQSQAGPVKVDFDDGEVRDRWENVYDQLTEVRADIPANNAALFERATAHIRRVAVIHAVLDGSSVVRLRHLEAALAVWRYCEETIRFVFCKDDSGLPDSPKDSTAPVIDDPLTQTVNTLSKEAQRLFGSLWDAWSSGLSENDISRRVFNGNKSAAVIDAALGELKAKGLADCIIEETGGKPRTMWYVVNESGEPAVVYANPTNWFSTDDEGSFVN
ncbi:MAG TPA: hypothetical protein VFD58_06525 [Blastocatellia bacterium]|nr:hypothetical protein [Blastocatellia bacterium]